MMARLAVLVLAGVLAAGPAQADDKLPDRTERVVGLARAWAAARVYHPYLGYKALDWDAALLAAIPKAEAATTVAEYRAAVGQMLGKLGDPVTRVIDPTPPLAAPPAGEWLVTAAPGIVRVEMAGFVGSGDVSQLRTNARRIVEEVAKAKVLILDCRVTPAAAGYAAWGVSLFAEVLPAIDQFPQERLVQHTGWRTQFGMTSGGYSSAFITSGAKPAKPAPKSGPSHVVAIANAAGVAGEVFALQAAGRATIIATAPLGEDSIVTTAEIELPGGIATQIRVGESLWGPPRADIVVDAKTDAGARALAMAKAVAGAKPVAKPRKVLELPPYTPRDDIDYPDPYPTRERRMLAAIRVWMVLEYFNPYRYLIADWERALRESLPHFEAATDRAAYKRALEELATKAGDAHIWIQDPSAGPRAALPVAIRLVENKVVVQRIVDAAEAKRLQLAVGDVVETIDGQPTSALIAGRRAFQPASNDEWRDHAIVNKLATGAPDSSVRLGVRGPDGKPRDVTVTRTVAWMTAAWSPPAAPHWKKLAGNIGFVDLSQLTVGEVDPMLTELAGTRAIVFDMRGYPQGIAWTLAPRLNVRGAKYAAQFLAPLVRGDFAGLGDTRFRFMQAMPPTPPGAALYRGKVVVLVDARAMSQSEHTCLFLQEAAGATFIGSPTAGANGDITYVKLPGGLAMSFTGQEVRHVDGKQLQRLGIQPHIVIRPTIAGVRAGKDEVLDRALAFIEKGK